ncbi:MAG: DUF898 family protein [Alphaproteobacteria bacterium]
MSDPTVAPVDAPPSPQARLSHDSTVAELVPMHLKFLALTLLTLGVYHFWARTHARRFLWSRTRLLDEPFVYLGRPVELLVGFVVAMVLVVAPVVVLNVVLLPQAEGDPDAGLMAGIAALSVVQAIAIPYLIFVGGYAARRYRLSRTAWRGIRGRQAGSAWTYGLWGMLYAMVTGVTLLWFYPWQRAKLARERLQNAWFGSLKFDCDVEGRDLVGAFAIMWFGIPVLGMILALVVGGLFAGLVAGGVMSGEIEGETDLNQAVWALQLLPLLMYLPLGLFYIIYRGHELRHVAKHTSFGEVRFEFTYGIWQYVGYAVGNIAILLLTLATGWIYVQRRQLKFWERFLVVSGDIDFAAVGQAADTGPRTGEGLAELFDTGFEIGF